MDYLTPRDFPRKKISYNCNGSTFVESFTTSGRRSVW